MAHCGIRTFRKLTCCNSNILLQYHVQINLALFSLFLQLGPWL